MTKVYYSREFYKVSLLYEKDYEAFWSDEATSGYGKFDSCDRNIDLYWFIELFVIDD